jgi:Flp pilus assembly protein TadD
MMCLWAALVVLACDRRSDLLEQHLSRGDAAVAAGRYPQALAAYGHARELAPHDPRVQRGQMWARVHVLAETPWRVGAEALDDVAYEADLLRGEKGREAVCRAALGNAMARRGDEGGAKVKLGEALRADPGSAVAHAAMGAFLMGRREGLAEAKAELQLALGHKPTMFGALFGLGQILFAEGDLAGAASRFEAALAASDDAAARVALGKVRLQQDKPELAAGEFQRAVLLEPKNAEALSQLGQALLSAGKLDEAERALRAALQLEGGESTSIALGYALARNKKSDEALAVFARVLSQDPTAPSALYGAGIASEDLGRGEQALAYYRRVLALPASGPQQQLVSELKKQATGRVTALTSDAGAPADAPAR